jgi:hypothetical protein
MRTLIILAAILSCSLFAAEDAVANFKKAMSTQDQAEKKKAIQGLLALPAEQDDTVLTLLASAVGDRQASSSAVSALRSRTGMQPSAKRGSGGFPDYPPEDSSSAWNAWITARKADLDLKKAAKDIEKKLEKIEQKIDPATDTSIPTDNESPNNRTVKNLPPPEDLGGLDRIHFVNGSTLIGYIVSKRTDAEGQLVSIRVVHRDAAGEESIAADLISRIDEDIQ